MQKCFFKVFKLFLLSTAFGKKFVIHFSSLSFASYLFHYRMYMTGLHPIFTNSTKHGYTIKCYKYISLYTSKTMKS